MSRFLFPILCASLIALGSLALSSCGLLFGLGMAKLQFGCLPEGVSIDTPDGPVAVELLQAGDQVIGYRGIPVTIRQVHQYREDPDAVRHIKVRFTNGAEVSLSPRHRIGGTQAGQLKVGDELGGHRVSAILPVTGVSRSFDLLTGDDGYRIHGVPVNSMIEEMAGQ